MTEPSPKEFRDAMRAFVGNCSVITTGEGEAATGLIVTSAISLSAEPPLLLACINRSSSSWPVLKESGKFGWSSLGAAHQPVAQRFSGFGGDHRPPPQFDPERPRPGHPHHRRRRRADLLERCLSQPDLTQRCVTSTHPTLALHLFLNIPAGGSLGMTQEPPAGVFLPR